MDGSIRNAGFYVKNIFHKMWSVMPMFIVMNELCLLPIEALYSSNGL